MKLTIDVLQCFQKVAELEHVTRAAEALQLAQPAVSRTISAMEKDFNIALFRRRGRNITLTRSGEDLLRHVNRVLDEFNKALEEIAEAKAKENLTVRLIVDAASQILPGFLTEFRQSYPDINFELLLRGTERRTSAISGANSNLRLTSGIKPVTNEHSVTLFREELLMALPEHDSRAQHPSVRLSDFIDDGFICLHKGQNMRKITDYYCEMAGFTPRVDLESDSLMTVREFICAGLGIAMVPQITWSNINSEHVVLVPISYPRCYQYITLTWDGSVPLSKPAILLKDYIINYFVGYARAKAAEAMRKSNQEKYGNEDAII